MNFKTPFDSFYYDNINGIVIHSIQIISNYFNYNYYYVKENSIKIYDFNRIEGKDNLLYEEKIFFSSIKVNSIFYVNYNYIIINQISYKPSKVEITNSSKNIVIELHFIFDKNFLNYIVPNNIFGK